MSSAKTLQEFGGGDGSAIAAAGVLDVADVGLDQVGVFLAEGHPPELLAGGRKRGLELRERLVVVGERAGVDLAQRDTNRAGQRRSVNEVGCAELASRR